MASHDCDDQAASKQLEVNLHRVIKTRRAMEFEKLFTDNRLGADYCFTRAPPLIALIQHLVQENFVSAVELVLTSAATATHGSSGSRVRMQLLRNAFEYAVRNDLREILCRFIDAALAKRAVVDVLSLDEAFECAMEKGLYDLAIQVSKDETFGVKFNGADVDPNRRRTPLHWAVFCEQPRLLEDFLHRGAVVDAEDRNGLTALAMACQMESYVCCRVLLNHGADPNHASRRWGDRSTPQGASCFSPRYHGFRTADYGGKGNPTPEEAKVVRILLLMRRAGLRSLSRTCEAQQQDNGIDVTDDRRSIQSAENSAILGMTSTFPLLTLEEECCRVIRRHLAAVSRGRSIAKRLENLPLPETILNHSLQLK